MKRRGGGGQSFAMQCGKSAGIFAERERERERERGVVGESYIGAPFLPFCKLTTANEATNERTNANRLFIAAFKGLFDF